MRRVVLIVLALVLVPSMATASWYRCAVDGMTRSICCCPAKADPQRKAPVQDASLNEGCCCTVTHIVSRAPAGEANPVAASERAPVVVALIEPALAPRIRRPVAAIDRPRAQGDPPDTLFARRCALLL